MSVNTVLLGLRQEFLRSGAELIGVGRRQWLGRQRRRDRQSQRCG